MKVTSLKAHRYAGTLRPAGAEYEIKSESDRRLAFALKWVKAAPEAVTPPMWESSKPPADPVEAPEVRIKRAYVRRNLAADVPVSDAAPQTYMTRDLTAE